MPAGAGWPAAWLENTLRALAFDPAETLVWLGPAIGPAAFEVGVEVREAFVAEHAEAASAFVPGTQPGKFMADIYQLARIRLAAQGVTAVYGGGLCTVSDQRFFSLPPCIPHRAFRQPDLAGQLSLWLIPVKVGGLESLKTVLI